MDAATGIITTVVGIGGTGGFGGDGNLATAAQLFNPIGLTFDSADNLYIADRDNQRIRKVNVFTGVITTVAGNGTQGLVGNGGPATSAQLNRPVDVIVDRAGNLYIAEEFSYSIRKVDAVTGIISVVAGTGTLGYSGDGGPATAAQMGGAFHLALDSAGNLYFADPSNQRIRRVDAATGIITTLAGTGRAEYNGDGTLATAASLKTPSGVALDGTNRLYIADYDNFRIRRVTPTPNGPPTIAPHRRPNHCYKYGHRPARRDHRR